MRFLTVAERELCAAARRKGTYILRWVTGVGFFVLLVWLMWAIGALQYKHRVHDVFVAFSVMVFFYCLLVGAIRTADCISSERREGTLGLLFLTNLNSLEIIAGKLCSNALPTVYGLLAIFPMLALPLLMGGVTPAEFARTLLALLGAILFSLGCGFTASVLCQRQFPAVALALGLGLVFGAGTLGAAAIIAEYKGPAWLVDGLCTLCPLYPVLAAEGGRIFNSNHYWLALGSVALISLAWLGLTTLQLARSWRDRPKSAPRRETRSAFWQSVHARQRAGRAALRHRLLNRNAFYWLTARRQISSPIFTLIVVVLVLITVFGTTPLFIKMMGSQKYAAVLGGLLAWLWTGLAIHLLTLYYAAMISSQALAEDKQTGALELIFATPVQERTILRGLGLGFRRRMLFPALAVFLTHGYFLWLVMTMALLEPPGSRFPAGTTQGQVFWASLANSPLGGRMIAWEFVLIVRVLVLILVSAVVLWFTLGRVGRWLGLRMKHPGFAPLVALALLVIPPTLLISVSCFVAEEFRFFRGSDRVWVPAVFYGSAAVVVGHCAILGGWAARHLRENFRSIVIGRGDVRRRSWGDRGWSVLRFTVRATGFAAACALLAAGYHGCQNYRSRHAWSAFQADLKQKGESLSVAELLPPPVPDEANFARMREFQDLVTQKANPLARMLNGMPDLDTTQRYQNQYPLTHAWTTRQHAPLAVFAGWIGAAETRDKSGKMIPVRKTTEEAAPATARPTNNAAIAPSVLAKLQPLDKPLTALATAAARRPHFQTTTNRSALTVLQPAQKELKALARLHFLFTLRALARRETGQTGDASEDLLTSLRLARLAGQSPDAAATLRAQNLLTRSLQPLWEGLNRHQWDDPQLAKFQTELATFDLLVNYTNNIARIVRANIELWRAIPEANRSNVELPSAGGGTRSNPDWRDLPRAGWFDYCIQLYHVGETAISDVDLAGEHLAHTLDWSDINDLPLDSESQSLLQMGIRNWTSADPSFITFAQTALNQARIAVALERHWLANQRYPATLKELVPARLSRIPHDVEVGRPMLYQPLTNGTYLLRGLGADHVSGPNNAISDDWIWAYPTNKPAAATPP